MAKINAAGSDLMARQLKNQRYHQRRKSRAAEARTAEAMSAEAWAAEDCATSAPPSDLTARQLVIVDGPNPADDCPPHQVCRSTAVAVIFVSLSGHFAI